MKKNQWQETLDLVSRGKSVWGEHPQIGECIIYSLRDFAAPDEDGVSRADTFRVYYPGDISHWQDAGPYSIRAYRAKYPYLVFQIIQVFDRCDVAIAAIRAVPEWNGWRPLEDHSGYCITRRRTPEGKVSMNIRFRRQPNGELAATIATFDPLPAIPRRKGKGVSR